MTNGHGPDLAERIAQRGREVLVERLRAAFARQVATCDRGVDLDPERLEGMVQEAAGRAGEALRRRSLAQAAMEELRIDLSAALSHPVLADAQELIDACGDASPSGPPALSQTPHGEPHRLNLGSRPERAQPRPTDRQAVHGEPGPMIADAQALRMSAVHLSGIETLYQGEDDLELRLSRAGLDVLKRSNGAAIGRLEWSEIETVELPSPKRGLRGWRRSRELHVSTNRGQAQFELPGLTEEELHEYLEPTLARLGGISTHAGNAAADGENSTAGSPADAG
jgi:hypothetical protein